MNNFLKSRSIAPGESRANLLLNGEIDMSHFVTKPSDLRHLPYTDYQCVEIVKALRAMDVEADTDDCSLLQAQLIGLMEGEGAPEDHRDVKAALAGMGLTPAGADLVHGCLVNILSAKLFEKSSALLPVVFPADVPEAVKNMKQNEYRGPLAWTAKVIDFAADYTAASGAADHSKLLPELLDLIRFQQEYMEAIPDDVRSRFPAMPSYDGDWAEGVVERAKAIAASAPVAPVAPVAPAPQPAASFTEGGVFRSLIEFLLHADDALAFLRCWNEGDFGTCRKEWPEAPPTLYPDVAPNAAPLQQGEYLPLAVASAPDRIWLDLGFDPKETDADFSDLNTPTWSADNASGHGIEYVRADRAARAAQAAPACKDSTPQLSVGESSFEDWYQSYLPNSVGHKQIARDAYAAGMGDPLVTAAPAPVAEDAIALLSEVTLHFTRDDDLPNDLLQRIDALLHAQAAQPEGGAKP